MKHLIYSLLLTLLSLSAYSFEGIESTWSNCKRFDFKFKERDVVIVAPEKPEKGNPWIWRPAFFGAFPSVDQALLKKGFHVVYYDLTHLYGSPRALELGTQFYEYLTTNYDLSPKVTLEGFSRGGLFCLSWATQNTDKIACIYLDAPVCNIFSWPQKYAPELWPDVAKEYQMEKIDSLSFPYNPIDNLKSIAEAKIPVLSVCGAADKTVPFTENMAIVRERLIKLGGICELILKPGVDHHPHSLEDPTQVVEFIVRNQPERLKNRSIELRGNLNHSFQQFEKGRKGRVAFLGGSITEMHGWRNMIQKNLQQRFPFTHFEFVDAGIGSTGTTPGAFRIVNDVLSKGDIDLLFVEAAVNDDTNHFTPEEQIKGMEGEVRHALEKYPNMDIIMLHFIYDPFISLAKQGKQPDVILNHERVANHYGISSINLNKEINARMQAGEFNWEQFGGTHPAPLGHQYYADAINQLFDIQWSGNRVMFDRKTSLPSPIDCFSYFGGDFLPLESAKLGKGWKLVQNWKPEIKAGTRNNFVDCPMIETNNNQGMLTLNFEGTAIGYLGVAGPDAAIIEYSVDKKPFKRINTLTEWSSGLYIPWVFMFEKELSAGKHELRIKVAKESSKKSVQIRNFVVNNPQK